MYRQRIVFLFLIAALALAGPDPIEVLAERYGGGTLLHVGGARILFLGIPFTEGPTKLTIPPEYLGTGSGLRSSSGSKTGQAPMSIRYENAVCAVTIGGLKFQLLEQGTKLAYDGHTFVREVGKIIVVKKDGTVTHGALPPRHKLPPLKPIEVKIQSKNGKAYVWLGEHRISLPDPFDGKETFTIPVEDLVGQKGIPKSVRVNAVRQIAKEGVVTIEVAKDEVPVLFAFHLRDRGTRIVYKGRAALLELDATRVIFLKTPLRRSAKLDFSKAKLKTERGKALADFGSVKVLFEDATHKGSVDLPFLDLGGFGGGGATIGISSGSVKVSVANGVTKIEVGALKFQLLENRTKIRYKSRTASLEDAPKRVIFTKDGKVRIQKTR